MELFNMFTIKLFCWNKFQQDKCNSSFNCDFLELITIEFFGEFPENLRAAKNYGSAFIGECVPEIGRKSKTRYAMSRPLCHYGSLTLDTERFGQANAEFRRCRLKDRTDVRLRLLSLSLLFCSLRVHYK